MRNDQYFAVDDCAAENHFSRCRCVDAPIVYGYGKVYARCPALQRWAGFSKGRITRGLDSAVGER